MVVDVLVILGWSIEKLGDLVLFPTLSCGFPVPVVVVVGGMFPLGVGDLSILEKENGDPRSIPEITLGALSWSPTLTLSPVEYPWALERPVSIYGESGRTGERTLRVMVLLTSGLVVGEAVVVGMGLKLGLWRTSLRLEILPFRLCPLPCLICVGRKDGVEVTDCCCEGCDCNIAVEEGVLGLEEVKGDSFGCAIIAWKDVVERGEAGLLFDEFLSESNGSDPRRSSVGVYLPFRLLDRNPPGLVERGVPVRDGCLAVEALESRRPKEELVAFIALL